MNNREIQIIAEQLKDTWAGDPWFGKPAQQLLTGITEQEAYEQPQGQHSIAQLIWHMANWRQFTISRLQPDSSPDVSLFETADWRPAAPDSEYTFAKGLQELETSQADLLRTLQTLEDSLLDELVAGRNYTFRHLLHGIVQHDIYHLGQIAYITKMLRAAG
ncbi:DinB family protein [Pseudocnuella soli]|uniref:DinB family protein n=1 Tax=Pseudocnuella soli TaxID=2502779 RepID=UPI00104B1E92|nr:DinB family protein [Pseudocnuella soli]